MAVPVKELRSLLTGVLVIRGLVSRVYIRAPDASKLPDWLEDVSHGQSLPQNLSTDNRYKILTKGLHSFV